MPYAPPRPHEMFSDASSSAEVASSFESYKSAVADSHDRTQRANLRFVPGVGAVSAANETAAQDLTAVLAGLEKSASADVLSSLSSQLETLKAVLPDLSKDWSSASPLSTGLVAYDLQAPAKLLLPRRTPLRNRTPRTTQGVGTTARYKRITGLTNLGVGGVADQTTFFNSEAVSTTFGGVTGLRRPPKISYAADEKAVLFAEQGLSDSVTAKATYQSQGFQDLRSLSHTALLWATMVGEEKNLLLGRSSASGFAGAIAAPTAVAATAVAAGAGQTGNSANIANLYIYVTAKGGGGESVASTVLNSTALAAVTGRVLNVTWTDSPGALGYNVYAGTTAGIASAWYYGTTGTNAFTMQFTGAGTGGALNSGTAPSPALVAGTDTTANAVGYDGFLTVLSDPTQSGYVGRQNATFSTTNPGGEFQTAFSAMFAKNMADPNVIYLYAGGRVALSDLLKTSSSSNYRLTIDSGEAGTGTHLGSLVTGLVNEVTGTMVDLEVHPYMPLGTAIIHSESLPMPDTNITSTTEVRNVVDYMAIEWPQIQLTFDVSTYLLGSLIFYAPGWSGAILGIAN
ncbi:MAG: hypothetical protein M3003_00865 [Candidatus Dormibacteraeota bacterium]|nr:hypothetical protein [Candidatus Dormibacteraeota bacterium]